MLGYETINKLVLIKAKQVKADCFEPSPYETLMLKKNPTIGRLIKIERLEMLNIAEITIANLTQGNL